MANKNNKYLAKITQIYERNGTPKISPEARGRIGRTFDISQSAMNVGQYGFFHCVYPGYEKSLHTSMIRDVMKTDSEIIVWTRNSIYVFERISF